MHFIIKEWLLIIRDLHSLLLLFLMPSVFILIMTFALQNQFSDNITIEYYLLNNDNSSTSETFIKRLQEGADYTLLKSTEDRDQLLNLLGRDKANFLIVIEKDFSNNLGTSEVLTLYTSPSSSGSLTLLFESKLYQALMSIYLEQVTADLFEFEDRSLPESKQIFFNTESTYKQQDRPSSVQQNVPAWLLFAMFFIAIPLSTTLLNEKQQGTLARLESMGASKSQFYFGKIVPYFFINLLQVIVMLIIGIWLIPLLGGDKLHLGDSLLGLIVIASSTSVAAICYALFIAQVTKSIEQATILSGICNIIMAAIGGVMVPTFVMPAVMQDLSQISPMSWALEGFFDILLRNGSVIDVLPESLTLVLFAIIAFALSRWIASRA